MELVEQIKSVRLVADLRCGTEVVGLCVLESSPGWLHCLPLAFNRLGNIARGLTTAVVSTAMGVAPCY